MGVEVSCRATMADERERERRGEREEYMWKNGDDVEYIFY